MHLLQDDSIFLAPEFVMDTDLITHNNDDVMII